MSMIHGIHSRISVLLVAFVFFVIPFHSTHAACTFTRSLSLGVRGADVNCLQSFLKEKGYLSGAATGFFGPMTQDAVATWQRTSGVIETPIGYGRFGVQSRLVYQKQINITPKTTTTKTKKTKTASSTPLCTITRTLALKTVGADVFCLETYLKSKGFLKEKPDTLYASSTKAAVSAWQTKNKIKVNKKNQGIFEKISLGAYKKLAKGKKVGGGGGGGGGGGSSSSQSAADTTAPTAPGTPTISSVTYTTLTLTWSASTDAVGVSGYTVYKDGSLLATGIAGTTYDVTGLTASTSYSFTVLAYDAANNSSAQSSAASSTTRPMDTTAPTAPGAISFSNVTTSSITLSFASSTDAVGVSGYTVYRGGTQIATSAVAFYTNSGLTASTSYSYTIAAYDAAGNVSARNATSSTSTRPTDTTAPTTPGTVTYSSVSSTSITLRWASSTDAVGVTGYRVYRGATNIATTSVAGYTNTGLTASTSYSYTVDAYDAAGNVSSRPATTSTSTTQASGGGGSYEVTLSTLNGTAGFKLNGVRGNASPGFNDRLGSAVARIGDVNADGYSDLIVGAIDGELLTDSSALNRGRAYVIFGTSTANLSTLANGTTGFNLNLLDGTQGTALSGSSTVNGQFGYSLAGGGDYNGDGIKDVLIGCSCDQVYVLYGDSKINGSSSGGFGALHNISAEQLSGSHTSGSNDVNSDGIDDGAEFGGLDVTSNGSSVSNGGDIDNDGKDDILIGNSENDTARGVNSGAAVIAFGATSATLDSITDADGSNGSNTVVFFGQNASDYAGYSVSGIGDINDDGYSDFAIGATSGSDDGKFYVIFGDTRANLIALASNSNASGLQNVLNGTNGFYSTNTPFASLANPAAGSSIAPIGDFNGDGVDDFIVNMKGVELSLVVFGTTSPSSASLNLTNILDTRSGGFGIAAGDDIVSGANDFNGDGKGDIIIGDTDGNVAYILFGTTNISQLIQTADGFGKDVVDITDGSSLSSSPVNLESGGYLYQKGVVLVGSESTNTGFSVAGIGDINADGYDDVIVGATLATSATETGSPAGQAYVIYGSDL